MGLLNQPYPERYSYSQFFWPVDAHTVGVSGLPMNPGAGIHTDLIAIEILLR